MRPLFLRKSAMSQFGHGLFEFAVTAAITLCVLATNVILSMTFGYDETAGLAGIVGGLMVLLRKRNHP